MQKICVYDTRGEIIRQISEMDFWKDNNDFELQNIISEENKLNSVLQGEKPDIFIAYVDKDIRKDIERMQVHFSGMHVIIISMDVSYEMVRSCFVSGIYDYLSYPLDVKELEDSIVRTGKSQKLFYIMTYLQPMIEEFVNHIYEGGGEERQYIHRIFDRIEEDWKENPVNVQKIVNMTKTRIYETVVERKKWIAKFLRGEEYKNIIWELKTRQENEEEWFLAFSYISKLVKKYQIIDNRLVYRIGNYVLVHVDEKLSLDRVAEGVYLNASYISSIFKKTTGINFTDYVAEAKVDRAKVLLYDTSRKIYDIAETLGYSNAEYFTKTFKKKTGIAPVEYQKKLAIPE